MDLETALNEHTIDKVHVYDGWIRRACSKPEALEQVMDKAFGGNERERKRGNWILHHVSDRNPEVFIPYLPRMVDQLSKTKTDAEMRFILRYLSKYTLPKDEETESYLIDFCFEKMMTPSAAQAPRVYSMSVLYRLVLRYPELVSELDESIEMVLEHANPGLKSRAKHVRKDLAKAGLI